MDIEDKIIAEKIKSAFENIEADSIMKQKAVEKTLEVRKKSKRKSMYGKMPAILVPLAALVIFTFGLSKNIEPVATISIDGENSVELSVDADERIIDVQAYGTEEENKAYEELKNLKYTEAVQRAVKKDAAYSVSIGSESRELSEGMADSVNAEGVTVENTINDERILDDAAEAEMSIGKYAVYMKIVEYDGNFRLEYARELSIKQLRDILSRLQEQQKINKEGAGHDSAEQKQN